MKKRVLFVQNRISFGGTSSLIMFITKNLSDEYVFDLLCYESGNEQLESEFVKYGGVIYRDKKLYCKNNFLGKIKSYFMRLFNVIEKRALKQLKNNNYYAIHCFEEFLGSYYLKAAHKAKVEKRIINFCNDQTTKRKLNFISKRLLNKEVKIINKYATDIVCDSSKSFSSLLDINKKVMIMDPIDEKFSYSDKIIEGPSLIQVGTICDNKNQLFSLNVINFLINKYNLKNCSLKYVGPSYDYDYRLKLENQIKQYGLSEKVSILPATSELQNFFHESSFLIFPSKKESFGMVLIEAQACGLHCFSSFAADQQTNLGAVSYLELENGPEAWSKFIFEFYSKNGCMREKCDLGKHNSEYVESEFRKLYEIK